MKVYWRNREGNLAPAGAKFSLHGFSSGVQHISSVEHMALPAPTRPIKILRKTFSPIRDRWIQNVQQALDSKIPKVVLARTCTLELEQAPDPFTVTAALQQKAKGAFVFCFQSENSAFLGASPERLFLRNGTQIICEAIAGTRKRGQTVEEDERLAIELLNSEKDLRENRFVQMYLQTVVPSMTFSPISVVKTPNVQHLYCRCSGDLKEGMTDLEIVELLHPTPALCGWPKEQAQMLIQRLELFDRGLYGGVVGWQTPESSEWAVAIRSCEIRGKTVTLYSGAGIVDGSDPKKEWDELDQKIKLYDGIFV